MNRFIALIVFTSLSAIYAVSYAVSDVPKSTVIMPAAIKAKMDRHIDKAKRSDPAQYQMMMERANNTVTDCLSCHVDLLDSNKN